MVNYLTDGGCLRVRASTCWSAYCAISLTTTSWERWKLAFTVTTAADRTKCCCILHREQWPANTGTSTVNFMPAGLPSRHQTGALASWKERSIGQRRTAWLTPSALWRPAPTQTSVGPNWLEMKMGRCTFPTSTGITTLAQASGQASERYQITSALWPFISSTAILALGEIRLQILQLKMPLMATSRLSSSHSQT